MTTDPNQPSVPAGDPRSGLRVLVVDDMPEVCHLARLLLTRRGAKVVMADGGEDALRVLDARQSSDEPIDVVLSDFMMPMNGSELLRHVRERFPRVPVIIYSAAMTPELREELLAAGVDDALNKDVLTPDGAQLLLDTFARSLAAFGS